MEQLDHEAFPEGGVTGIQPDVPVFDDSGPQDDAGPGTDATDSDVEIHPMDAGGARPD